MRDYKELIVWQKSMALASFIYTLTRGFPREELFGLTNQIRRAVVSIPSNIAEGHSRGTDKEFVFFLRIAKGSAAEVETQLLLSKKLGYINDREIKQALTLYNEIVRMLGTLIFKIGKSVEVRD
ncbi:four helix bundle protein [Dialister histaminiformans]|uniref:Four helix bundle protein n=1 Tax=Allisonella histaminiformans TaxID=209880 RepID=A0A1G5WTG3_9FIRM|nr:four helix bundle protein [Allisonella histaminiformans]SDA61441.1 four helix bundle protein [Allisonella histaminiformans]